MNLFNVLDLVGGLVLFLFGMNLMGQGLEKRAGNKLKNILGNMTSNTFKGFLLGLGVTAVIQSSSATTVMVVGFVNSGLMTLKQSIGVIMGANLGTSVTSWLLSMSGIDGDVLWIQLLKPSSFTPVLAFVGIIFYMFQKSPKRKDTGLIFLGFAVLMFGMDAMSASVSGLKNDPAFTSVLTAFSNPILGVIVGTVVTAIVQSSSASVGILQALSTTGAITVPTAVPIIMGQNIGTCVSAMISSIGASKNARRASIIHLSFNVIATLILLPVYYLVMTLIPDTLSQSITEYKVDPLSIAVLHTGFKILALLILMPCSNLLLKIACSVVKENKNDEFQLLDDRLLATPTVAVERSSAVARDMAKLSVDSLFESLTLMDKFDAKLIEKLRDDEGKVDTYEDKLGSYLLKISSHELSPADSAEVTMLLHIISDFERISDHALNISGSFEEIADKGLEFSADAKRELGIMVNAIKETLTLSLDAFCSRDLGAAIKVEPLEQVIDDLAEELKSKHVDRLKRNECTIEMGFILTDILTNLERISDHCSNIAGCIIEMEHKELDIHKYLKSIKTGENAEFAGNYESYKAKYSL